MDLQKLGFKSGLEIHQRLDTNKLFCGCYCDPNKPLPSGTTSTIRRRLRAVVGELGQVDRAASFETAREREFEYVVPNSVACLVETDDEPPHEINRDALAVALQVALLLNAKPVDEIQVMRKTVVDGSAVSGFQRTALIATGGFIETSKGKVGIPTICLEEESAGIVEKKAEKSADGREKEVAVYRLDRLGIPLVEIATDATITDGGHARETAEKIGALLRATGKVQRGLGTIRQDLNVSIAEGGRCEIKGAQELKDLEALVDGEARRQAGLVEIRKELQERKASLPASPQIKSVSDSLNGVKEGFVSKMLASGAVAMGIRLEGFAGLLGKELLPDHRFGTELSDYAKAAAGVKGIIHSDEDPEKYGFDGETVAGIMKELGTTKNDAWVLVVADEATAARALGAVFERAGMALREVPKETRRAEGVSSHYMRPLPGGARMYPETDAPSFVVKKAWVDELEKSLPKRSEERLEHYRQLGLNDELAVRLAKSSQFLAFEALVAESGAGATMVATALLETIPSLRREGVAVDLVKIADFAAVLRLYSEDRITRVAVSEFLRNLAKGVPLSVLEKDASLLKFGEKILKEKIAGLKKEGIAKDRLFAEAMRRYRLNADAAGLKKALA